MSSRWTTARWSRTALPLLTVLALLTMLLPPAPLRAESPFADPDQAPTSGMGNGPAVLPAAPVPGPVFVPGAQAPVVPLPPTNPVLAQQSPEGTGATNSNNPLTWLKTVLNPGAWVVQSVMGAFTGVLNSISGVLAVIGRFGLGYTTDEQGKPVEIKPPNVDKGTVRVQAAESGGLAPLTVLFLTPPELTYLWQPGSLGNPQNFFTIVQDAALSLLVIILAYRAVLAMTGRNYIQDLIELAISLIGGTVWMKGAWFICMLMIQAANALTVQISDIAFPKDWLTTIIPLQPDATVVNSLGIVSQQGVSITVALVVLGYWFVVCVLCFYAVVRMVVVNLLMIVSPLAGLAFATGGGWNYARVWFFRFLEALVTPLIWAIVLGIGMNLIARVSGDSLGLVRFVLGIMVLCMLFKAPYIVGLAAQETVSGGGKVLKAVGDLAKTGLDAAVGSMTGGATPAAAAATDGGSVISMPTPSGFKGASDADWRYADGNPLTMIDVTPTSGSLPAPGPGRLPPPGGGGALPPPRGDGGNATT